MAFERVLLPLCKSTQLSTLVTIHNKYAEKFMEILKKITEPVYKFIGKKVPPVAGFDISPYVLLLAIFIVGSIITNLSIWFRNYL